MTKGLWIRTKEYKEKISKIHKAKGTGKWMQGRKLSETVKEKMKISHKTKMELLCVFLAIKLLTHGE